MTIDVSLAGGVLSIEVSDNGRGLQAEDLVKAKSFGLRGPRERAETVGGWVDLSGNTGGTTLIVSVPITPHMIDSGLSGTGFDRGPHDPSTWDDR